MRRGQFGKERIWNMVLKYSLNRDGIEESDTAVSQVTIETKKEFRLGHTNVKGAIGISVAVGKPYKKGL